MDDNKMIVTCAFIAALAIVALFSIGPVYYAHKNALLDKQATVCMDNGKRWVSVDKDPDGDVENIVWECQ